MAYKKVTELDEITSISASSILLYGVDISGGSPAYGKISGSNLGAAISGSGSGSVSTTIDILEIQVFT
jgi:hypothetical protein